jgi:hypothetical protein
MSEITLQEELVTPERVAGVINGIPAIGAARDALTHMGWAASITGNRISTDDGVTAQFVAAAGERWWVVSGPSSPVWVVGTGP